MTRHIALIGAPSAIGIRPYDDGTVRRLYDAPAVLRDLGLAAHLEATDLGDVVPPPYQDFTRPPRSTRNEEGVEAYSRALADRIGEVPADAFLLVVGGDCSIVLGCMLGMRRRAGGRIGLAYVDAHADFATPAESGTGSAASMCLAQAVGRGDTPLARLGGAEPLVRAEDVVLLARSDQGEDHMYFGNALQAQPLLDIVRDDVRKRGAAASAHAALERLASDDLAGFWIHVDADVIDPAIVPAVDSPEAGGLSLDELAALLAPLVQDRRALGMELTIYDPGLDPDRTSAAQIMTLLERVLRTQRRTTTTG